MTYEIPTSTDWYVATRNAIAQARNHWKSFVLFAVIGGLAGGITALVLPSYYQAGAAFQAETTQQVPFSSALAGLASQLTNFPLGAQNGAQFFADLLTTDAVLGRVAEARFPWHGSMSTLSTIYGVDRESKSLQDFEVKRKLRSALNVSVNIRTNVVRFTVEARTPELATAVAETTLVALNAANIDLRQARAGAERTFTSGRVGAAREGLDSAEGALANFYQRNRVIAGSPALQMEEARLKRAVDVAQQVYIQLRLQEEQAAVQEVRNTPAISVIDPPSVPVRRSWPKRRMTVLIGVMIGIMIAALRLMIGTRSAAEV